MRRSTSPLHCGPIGSALAVFSVASCVALASSGCDESLAPRAGGVTVEAPEKPQDSKSSEPGVVVKPPASSRDKGIAAYEQCYHGCFTADTNATNRETCKLQCDSLAEDDLGARGEVGASDLYQHLRGCLLACWEDPKLSKTNRETCLLTCTSDATIDSTTPPKQKLEVVPGTVLAPGATLPPGVEAPVRGAK